MDACVGIRGNYRKRLVYGKYSADPKLLQKLIVVDESTGCHVWQGKPNANGYGRVGVDGKDVLAHRFAYAIKHGDIPSNLAVCHHCDNRLCVNVDHLFLGTISDNHADMVSKGRQQKGSRHYRAKLTEADVVAIRNSAEQKPTLAVKYGVAYGTIKSIVNRQNWKHVP